MGGIFNKYVQQIYITISLIINNAYQTKNGKAMWRTASGWQKLEEKQAGHERLKVLTPPPRNSPKSLQESTPHARICMLESYIAIPLKYQTISMIYWKG